MLAELNEMFCWLLVPIPRSDLIMSSMEDSEAWSDRALSSCSCLWLAITALFCWGGKVSVSPVLHQSMIFFLVDQLGQALMCNRPDIHFCCLLLAVVLLRDLPELPSRARFRQFRSCPLESMTGRFRAPSQSFNTSLLNPKKSLLLMGVGFVWDTQRGQ